MKLKNKKTGEIGDIAQTSNNAIIVYYPIVDGVAINPQHRAIYESLAELNEEWEDAPEEPKGYWFINSSGGVDFIALEDDTAEGIDGSKQIGNYFETKEEAEKAEEKLKAAKRLKDKGFRFHEWYEPDGCEPFIVIETNIDLDDVDNMKLQKDLDLLFGGEK